MFNSDPNSKPVNAKLPKAVIMMVEKGNLVIAIKTLVADENISMDAAKNRIDAYETELKVKQQQKLNAIANKQGIPHDALTFDTEQTKDSMDVLIKDRVKTTPPEQNFKSLQKGLDSQLNDLGYKKPLIPYWAKRLLVIAIIMAGLFWILWRVFG
ncbi:hypothetical protein ES754_01550 [Psychrobacter frigidicola]|uniref:LMBR1 domain-containing protein n=1 Tax=Psychrobacter frigidicola TaxID=45611 RepID=A0A5C7AA58_9GAMM|nr:hypothetical protein [Psychrobacter frigidicola]TXD97693.1 hypothetical protein ES754_01550 [Psychrobacter frigidicola]